jgi:hypothetical protein
MYIEILYHINSLFRSNLFMLPISLSRHLNRFLDIDPLFLPGLAIWIAAAIGQADNIYG